MSETASVRVPPIATPTVVPTSAPMQPAPSAQTVDLAQVATDYKQRVETAIATEQRPTEAANGKKKALSRGDLRRIREEIARKVIDELMQGPGSTSPTKMKAALAKIPLTDTALKTSFKIALKETRAPLPSAINEQRVSTLIRKAGAQCIEPIRDGKRGTAYPDLAGSFTLTVKVNPDGSVSSVQPNTAKIKATDPLHQVIPCVIDLTKAQTFASGDQPSEITVPIAAIKQ